MTHLGLHSVFGELTNLPTHLDAWSREGWLFYKISISGAEGLVPSMVSPKGKVTVNDFSNLPKDGLEISWGFFWICECVLPHKLSRTAGECVLWWKLRQGRGGGDREGQSLSFGESQHNTVPWFYGHREGQKKYFLRAPSWTVRSVPGPLAASLVGTPCLGVIWATGEDFSGKLSCVLKIWWHHWSDLQRSSSGHL